MNISDVKKEDCSGCMLCVNVCPTKCIQIISDEEGFLIPHINNIKCIDCSKCINVCQKKTATNYPQSAYAIQIREQEHLKKSASGGIAFKICEKTILDGGTVYGAVYTEQFRVKHEKATTIDALKKQQGSKYVQSDISSIYADIEKDCKKDIPVNVIGTPCQIAAIKKYLKFDYPNLLLIDLICHGVPSPNLFSKYLQWKKESVKAGEMTDYQFRDKENGWGHHFKVTFDKKEIYGTALEEPYYSDFMFGYSCRESCYKCQYAQPQRVGDITIGDYWGLSKYQPDSNLDDEKGVSCVLINTDKGKIAFENISSLVNVVYSSVEHVIAGNHNLRKPANRPEIRNEYYQNIDKYGFDWSKKQIRHSVLFYKSWIMRHIPKKFKKFLKTIYRRIK